jgi:hypothetical protein
MTDTEVLKKAIEKAVENGWDKWGWKNFQVVMGGIAFYDGKGDFVSQERTGNLDSDYDVIFDHSFAKAFWADGKVLLAGKLVEVSKETAWQENLQQMVLYENPIDYLRKFVEEQA